MMHSIIVDLMNKSDRIDAAVFQKFHFSLSYENIYGYGSTASMQQRHYEETVYF